MQVGSKRTRGLARRLAIAAGWLVAWQLASLGIGNRILFAGPAETAAAFLALLPTPAFWAAIGFSLVRIAAGFATGFVLALVLGGLAHASRLMRDVLHPLLAVLKSTPLVCFIVLLLLWVGSRRVSGIAVFLVAFPAVYFCVLEGLDAVDPKMRDLLHAFRVGQVRRALALDWQTLLPFLLATCKNVCGMSWKAGVAAEVIGTPYGSMGEQIYQSKLLLETPSLFAWTIAVILVSFACEKAFLALLGRTGGLALRLSVRLPHAATAADPRPAAVAFRGVTLVRGGKTILRNLTHEFAAGSVTVLADPSGAGKTTALMAALGLLAPAAGEVDRPQRSSAVFQEVRLVEGLSAVGNVLLACGGAVGEDEARDALAQVLPAAALDRPVSELSGGQRRRVELVRAMLWPSSAVLLDEPFSSLDEGTRDLCARFVLARLAGRTLVVSSHQEGDAEALGVRPSLIL